MVKKCKKNESELYYTLTRIGLAAEDWTITEMAEHFRAFADILEAIAKRNGEDCETIVFDGELPYLLAILKHVKSGKTLEKYMIEKAERNRRLWEMLHGQEEADNADNNT